LSAAQAPSSAPRGRPPTRSHQVVDFHAGSRHRALLAEPRKVPAVPRLGGGERRGAAPREAPFGAQVLRRVLLDAHQHVEPPVARPPYEGLVEQRLHRADGPGLILVCGEVQHGLGGLHREAALEHRELRQRRLVGQRQQIPRPVEGRAQRRLPVTAPAGRRQQLEPLAHAREKRSRRHHAHSRCGQFDRQRQALEQLHQRIDGRTILFGRLEVALRRLRPLHEKHRGVGGRERRQREGLLPHESQHLARGHHEACLCRPLEPSPQRFFGVTRHLLEVVENDQTSAARCDGIAELGDRLFLAQRNGECLGDGVCNAVQASGLRQIAEPDTAGEVSEPAPTEARDQPRLARATDPQHRDETRAGVEAARQFGQGLATAHEGIKLGGQAVLDVPGRQPDVALADHAIALGCIGGRHEQRVGLADLEQLDRLCNAFHAPVTVRLDSQGDFSQGVSRIGG